MKNKKTNLNATKQNKTKKTPDNKAKKTAEQKAKTNKVVKLNKSTVKNEKNNSPAQISIKKTSNNKESNVGKVVRGRTKFIDKETKKERNYVIVVDNGKVISVSKLKSIKLFTEDNKNGDPALVEINAEKYGLERRTGVDFEVFRTNLMSKQPLKIKDKEVFPEEREQFKLGSHDLHRVLQHTGRLKRKKRDND